MKRFDIRKILRGGIDKIPIRCIDYIRNDKEHYTDLTGTKVVGIYNHDTQFFVYGDYMIFTPTYDYAFNRRAGVLR